MMESETFNLEGVIESDRFSVTGKIGNGSWGGVYKAVDKEFDAPVAIKILEPNDLALEQMAQRNLDAERAMKKEARPLKATSHIVPSWTDRDKNGKPFLIMPFYERFLSDAINYELSDERKFLRKGLDLEDINRYMISLASGLSELHFILKRVHGDIKPDNLALDENGNILVADLGSSTLTSFGSVSPRDNIGFICTRAPECFDKDSRPSSQSDVWAFGSLMYRLFTGKYIFEDELANTKDTALFYEQVKAVGDKLVKQKLKQIPHAYRSLLRDCLKFRYYERIQTGVELEDRVKKVLEEGRTFSSFMKFLRFRLLPIGLPVVAFAALSYLAETREPTSIKMPKVQLHYDHVEAPDTIVLDKESIDLPEVDLSIREGNRAIRRTTGNMYVAGLAKAYDRAFKFLQLGYKEYITSTQFDEWLKYTYSEERSNHFDRDMHVIAKNIEVGLVKSRLPNGKTDLEDACAIARLGLDTVQQARRAANSFEFKNYITARDVNGNYIVPESERRFILTWLAYINRD
ncbi:protein kinase [Candidatus Woesearchaeota archaeon]|nr:protein kinase [Candidatus Woesearchaeota archaeon]